MSTTLGLVGDLMFSHRVREAQEKTGDPMYPLSLIAPTLENYDLLVGNLETPISLQRRVVPGSRPDYWALAGAADAVASAGFDLVSLANNHVWDFGAEGVVTTMAELDRVGVAHVGLDGLARPFAPVTVVAPDGTRFGFLAYCGMRNVATADHEWRTVEGTSARVLTDITALKASVDVVVVILHGGGSALPDPDLEARARSAVSAGATLCVIHHAHVVSGIERVGSGAIAWGLGNFLAGTNNFADDRREGMILRCDFDGATLVDVSAVLTWIDEDARVILAPAGVADRVRARISQYGDTIRNGGARTAYEHAITADVVRRRLVEAVRETMRGGGRNILPTIRSLRPRHVRFVLLGVKSVVRKASGRVRSLLGQRLR